MNALLSDVYEPPVVVVSECKVGGIGVCGEAWGGEEKEGKDKVRSCV